MCRSWFVVVLVLPLTVGCAQGLSDGDGSVVKIDAAPPVLGGRDMQAPSPPPADGGMTPMMQDDQGGPAMVVDAAAPRPMGDPACAQLADCLTACNSGPCAQMCRETAPVESSARYDAIFACGRDQGCAQPGGGFDDDCMEARCEAETTACYGPPAGPPPAGMGVLTCDEVATCLTECPAADIPCRDDCYRAASPEGHAAYTAALACVDECPAGDYTCRFTQCRSQLTACYGPQPPAPMGAGSCRDLNSCLSLCADGDQACSSACYGQSSPAGFNGFFTLGACMDASNCPANDTACIQRACEAEWAACFGAVPMGAANCAEFNECVSACEGDEACFDDCVDMASVEGYAAWVTAIQCIQDAGCANGDQACVNANCMAEVEACLGPSVMPAGNATCMEFNNCLAMCNQDRMCTDVCIGQASPEGYRRLLAVFDCFTANMCAGDDPNCQRLCMNEITACQTHR